MLANKELKAFVPTIQPDKAKSFYRDILGLKLLSEDDRMEFDANKVLLRVITVPKLKAQAFTVLDWNVGNISSTIKHLNKKGVYFEKYEFLD